LARDGLRPRTALNAIVAEWLRYAHSTWNRQWAYGHMAPRVFLEENVAPADGPLDEFKMFTFGGQVERIVRQRKYKGESGGQIFERGPDGRHAVTERAPTTVAGKFEAPPSPFIEEMIEEATKIAQHFDHVRVDFMSDGAQYWIGELTLYNVSG